MFVGMNALISAKETFRPTYRTTMQVDELWPAQITPSGFVIVWLPDESGFLCRVKFAGDDNRIYVKQTFKI